jgi:hypothetical protein
MKNKAEIFHQDNETISLEVNKKDQNKYTNFTITENQQSICSAREKTVSSETNISLSGQEIRHFFGTQNPLLRS